MEKFLILATGPECCQGRERPKESRLVGKGEDEGPEAGGVTAFQLNPVLEALW